MGSPLRADVPLHGEVCGQQRPWHWLALLSSGEMVLGSTRACAHNTPGAVHVRLTTYVPLSSMPPCPHVGLCTCA